MKNAIQKMKASTDSYSNIGGMSAEVGLPSNIVHEPSGKSLAEIGAIHEFGLGDVPERSFLRSTMTVNREEIVGGMTMMAKKASEGENPRTLMTQFALFGAGLVQERMRDLSEPPLASPRKDGSDNPLVDTGALRQGVIGVVTGD